METFEDKLSDQELNQMLELWTVPEPSPDLQTRIFAKPIFVTPVKVGDRQGRSIGAAFFLQLCAAALLFGLLTTPVTERVIKTQMNSILLAPYRAKLPSASQTPGGGGGGGQRALTPVAKGAPPKFAVHPFVPPAVAVPKPLLPMVPTISAPAPQVDAAVYGDPLSRLNDASGGQGINGLGNGKGGGLGNGNGDGLGDGSGGGTGGGVFAVGGNVSSPTLISKVEPEYSDQARKAKYSGKVVLSVVVDENGIPQNIQVVGPLGLGLDEKALEAVQHWRFKPGMRNGKPVKVRATIEVSFRLL